MCSFWPKTGKLARGAVKGSRSSSAAEPPNCHLESSGNVERSCSRGVKSSEHGWMGITSIGSSSYLAAASLFTPDGLSSAGVTQRFGFNQELQPGVLLRKKINGFMYVCGGSRRANVSVSTSDLVAGGGVRS